MLRFDGKVVVITGASGGIGKQISRYFANRGARLLLNDLGCSVNGVGSSKETLDNLVAELVKINKDVFANYDSVENGQNIIKDALNRFGRVDILVNNAGIIKDGSFQKATHQDWHKVIDVNLKGTYLCTKACWKLMLDQKFGRIINTCSAVGLYGNFGQANYTTAKLALHGLTLTLSKEGQKKNVLVNSIAPIAASRMTQKVFPPDMLAMIKTQDVANLIGYLTHQTSTENGSLFEVSGGWVSKVRWQRSKSIFSKELTAEQVQRRMDQVNDFSQSDNPTKGEDTFLKIMEMAKL